MATKSYAFAHKADIGVLLNELQKELGKQARKHGLALEHQGRRFRLHGSGADLTVAARAGRVDVTVALGWLAEMARGRIEAGLTAGVPKLLRRAEQLSRASRARRS